MVPSLSRNTAFCNAVLSVSGSETGSHDMAEHQMNILDFVDAAVRNCDTEVDEALQIASIETGQPDGDCPRRPGYFDRIEHVGGLAAPADADGYVSRFNLFLQLLGEDVLV